MDFAAVRIPQISISPAPPEEPVVEPYSPFSVTSFTSSNEDSFRSQHLTPPPSGPMHFCGQSSPLRPPEVKPKGLEHSRFQALLKATKERNAVGRKENDLRKEIALKTHRNKQLERRALFLSKVMAPPSPTATSLPKTPPESPAIFHYSLPSPGLVSPLSLFETLNDDPAVGPLGVRNPWVEQVDFRLPGDTCKPKCPAGENVNSRISEGISSLPSLDQISAHIHQRHVRRVSSECPLSPTKPQSQESNIQSDRPRLTVGVGRLHVPVRTPKPARLENICILPPNSPKSPFTPNLQITTTVVPRTATTSPTQLSESNLLALDSRSRRASDMLSTLKRRTMPSERARTGHEVPEIAGRRWKRQSAPAELQSTRRIGFEHPILSLPGAF